MNGGRKGISLQPEVATALDGLAAGDSDAGRAMRSLLRDGLVLSSVRAGPLGTVAFTGFLDERGPTIAAIGNRVVAALVRPHTDEELAARRRRGELTDARGAVRGAELEDWFDDDSALVDAYNVEVVEVLDVTEQFDAYWPGWSYRND